MKVYLVKGAYHSCSHRTLLRVYATQEDARNWILALAEDPLSIINYPCKVEENTQDPRCFTIMKKDPPAGGLFNSLGEIVICEAMLHGSPLTILAAQAE